MAKTNSNPLTGDILKLIRNNELIGNRIIEMAQNPTGMNLTPEQAEKYKNAYAGSEVEQRVNEAKAAIQTLNELKAKMKK
jgi:hypothetical protein